MPQDANRLIWIDLEMSGLNPDTDKVLEIAIVVTDSQLATVAEAPVLVLHQSDAVLAAMDSWNKSTHGKSGLLERVKSSPLDEGAAEARMVEFLGEHVPPGASPMCGNSVHQDRRFLARYMPRLEAYFHYRNLDVSTLKELARRWAPEVASGFQKASTHLAMDDIRDSIRELAHYRAHFLRIP